MTFNTDNLANADSLRVGAGTVQVTDGSNLGDAAGNDASEAGPAITISGAANTAPSSTIPAT